VSKNRLKMQMTVVMAGNGGKVSCELDMTGKHFPRLLE